MRTTGQHYLIEFFGCASERLDDARQLGQLLRASAELAGARVVGELVHPFSPHGVTALVLVEESHLSIHTWPETGYAAVDFYTCGDVRAEKAIQLLAEQLRAREIVSLEVRRGGPPETTLGVGIRESRTRA
ncbi:MAG TPA: adenosylmethionine decarboxylase [Polyangiaceae bacterium]|nr:adenosylmethionine decarboxylase [Polyangiaceae bacterium]